MFFLAKTKMQNFPKGSKEALGDAQDE